MPRVTKAALERRNAELSGQVASLQSVNNRLHNDAYAWEQRTFAAETELTQIKDLYTRVRVAIAGGTGQEPWDIFAKIDTLKFLAGLRPPPAPTPKPTRWERARTKARAWWATNHEAVTVWGGFIFVAGLWFLIGRASAQ